MPSAIGSVARTCSCAVAALAVTVGALSCKAGRVQNPWLNPRTGELLNSRWQELPAERFREVAAGEARAEAVRMLATDAAQRLPGRDVQRFVPGDVFTQPVGRFYLLRAVGAAGQHGSYQVLTSGRAVTVRYNGLAGSSDTVQSAILADLQNTPENVYVEVAVAR